MAFPANNPSSNSNGGLLDSLALARGITNFSTLLGWEAKVEVLLCNLLQDLAPQTGSSTFGRTLTALGTAQNTTPTAAQILGGILTQTSATGAGTCTLPIGTLISAALPVAPSAGASFRCTYINLGGGQTVTITGDTGTTVVGTAAVPTGKACEMIWVATSATAWTIICVLSA